MRLIMPIARITGGVHDFTKTTMELEEDIVSYFYLAKILGLNHMISIGGLQRCCVVQGTDGELYGML